MRKIEGNGMDISRVCILSHVSVEIDGLWYGTVKYDIIVFEQTGKMPC